MSAAPRRASSFRGAGGGAAPAWLFAFVAFASFGAVAVALVSQHAYRMDPCPWCVLERLIFVAIGVLALLGLVCVAPRHRQARLPGSPALRPAKAGFACDDVAAFVGRSNRPREPDAGPTAS